MQAIHHTPLKHCQEVLKWIPEEFQSDAQNFAIERKRRKMADLMVKAKKTFDQSFSDKLQILLNFLYGKEKMFLLLNLQEYPIPSMDGKEAKFFYDVQAGNVCPVGSHTPITACSLQQKTEFVSEVLRPYEKVKQVIEEELDMGKVSNIESIEKNLRLYKNGLFSLGTPLKEFEERRELKELMDLEDEDERER